MPLIPSTRCCSRATFASSRSCARTCSILRRLDRLAEPPQRRVLLGDLLAAGAELVLDRDALRPRGRGAASPAHRELADDLGPAGRRRALRRSSSSRSSVARRASSASSCWTSCSSRAASPSWRTSATEASFSCARRRSVASRASCRRARAPRRARRGSCRPRERRSFSSAWCMTGPGLPRPRGWTNTRSAADDRAVRADEDRGRSPGVELGGEPLGRNDANAADERRKHARDRRRSAGTMPFSSRIGASRNRSSGRKCAPPCSAFAQEADARERLGHGLDDDGGRGIAERGLDGARLVQTRPRRGPTGGRGSPAGTSGSSLRRARIARGTFVEPFALVDRGVEDLGARLDARELAFEPPDLVRARARVALARLGVLLGGLAAARGRPRAPARDRLSSPRFSSTSASSAAALLAARSRARDSSRRISSSRCEAVVVSRVSSAVTSESSRRHACCRATPALEAALELALARIAPLRGPARARRGRSGPAPGRARDRARSRFATTSSWRSRSHSAVFAAVSPLLRSMRAVSSSSCFWWNAHALAGAFDLRRELRERARARSRAIRSRREARPRPPRATRAGGRDRGCTDRARRRR